MGNTDKEEICQRLDRLESKVEELADLVKQAKGAWVFAKWIGGLCAILVGWWEWWRFPGSH